MARFAQPIPQGKLEREIALRGLSPQQVAYEAGLGRATLSRAMAGRRVTLATLLAISNVISRHPVIDNIVALITEEPTA